MKKVFLAELNADQLQAVVRHNMGLRHAVREDIEENEFRSIMEHMEYYKKCLMDYSISTESYSYIVVKDGWEQDFCEGLRKADEDIVGYMTDETYDFLETVEYLLQRMEECEAEGDMDKYEELKVEMREDIDRLAELLIEDYFSMLGSATTPEAITEYFVDFYWIERLDHENCYIYMNEDGDSDYIMHEDISYTKTYQ